MSERYWGFLSYSHADEAAASRLHRALERYSLPRHVRKAYALPAHLTPIFRDVEELEAASGLNTRLRDALDDSRWLIVLCSPASAKSKYVNAEIKYFLGKNGPERILCVLLEGEPPDCFPPAIRSLPDEPLAADLRAARDEQLARIKLIAALAGVGFTELRNREALRKRQQKLLVVAGFVVASLGGLAYWDLFRREHVDHYVSTVRHNGIWDGIDPLTAAQASRRFESYRFIRHGRLNPPRRVDYVNGSGQCLHQGLNGPLGHPRERFLGWVRERYCSVQFIYREGGELAREDWLNNVGQLLDSLTYTETGLAQFTQKGFASAEGASGVHYIEYERDAAGLDRRVRFLHSLGNPRQNARHEFGWALDYDAAGRVVRRSVLDDEGREAGPVARFHFDEHGALVETRYTNLDDQPFVTQHGYSTQVLERDTDGNIVLERPQLPDGSPAYAVSDWTNVEYLSSGFAAMASTWDGHGNNIERRRLDAAGHVVADRLNIAIERMTYDDRGNVVRQEALDADGHAVVIANEGVSSVISKYGADNSLIQISAFDTEGKPANRPFGASMSTLTYGDEGRSLTECFFDSAGRPAIVKYGPCLRWSLDGRGNPVAIDFLEVDGKPHARLDSGVARTVMHRDDRGNRTGATHYDANLKPVVNRLLGQAATEIRIDDYGNAVELRRLDPDRRLMRGKNGVAIERVRYDRSGNRIEETYFDEQQRPARNSDGYFGFRAQYDSRGRLTRREYLDAGGGLMKIEPLGAYGERQEYDAFGALVAEVLLDAGGKDGARIVHVHDGLGREVEYRYQDANGVLAAHPKTGCSKESLDLDRVGRTIMRRCLDANDHLVNRRDGGWAIKKIVPEVSGVDQESYFDATGRPVKPVKPAQ